MYDVKEIIFKKEKNKDLMLMLLLL